MVLRGAEKVLVTEMPDWNDEEAVFALVKQKLSEMKYDSAMEQAAYYWDHPPLVISGSARRRAELHRRVEEAVARAKRRVNFQELADIRTQRSGTPGPRPGGRRRSPWPLH